MLKKWNKRKKKNQYSKVGKRAEFTSQKIKSSSKEQFFLKNRRNYIATRRYY